MDWAQMLERMYLRWADSQGFKSAIVDRLEGLHVITCYWQQARASFMSVPIAERDRKQE